ncbi:GNAT family N-acetyltransferase [Nocardioides rubriscoriae]|uniref:GNAT family N-acetyltransferase n=1 Tax=Nocardioides rubriscoriae TaxID=642762 RepID=UPI0011DF2D6A|nr:N-acetyltransferase [Nocardioides rubriscoriae]
MDDLRIRPATTADAPAVRRVVAAAFGDDDPGARHGVADLVTALEVSGHVRSSLVAEADGQVVGYVQLNHSWLDARERLLDVLVLSPLSVTPARQGEGIGTALVGAAIADADTIGAPALFLEGSPRYYGARGFTRAVDLGFGRPSTRIPDPAFQVRLLATHEPWMTGRLVYAEPFWALDCVGLRDPDLAGLEATPAT